MHKHLTNNNEKLETKFYVRGSLQNPSLLNCCFQVLPKVLTTSLQKINLKQQGYTNYVNWNFETPLNWDNFVTYLKNDIKGTERRRIAGEVAAEFFFKELGYVPLPNSTSFEGQCITQYESNNGIDLVLIHRSEINSYNKGVKPSHIIINEAKCHLSPPFKLTTGNNFGIAKFYTLDDEETSQINRQGHSFWNQHNFKKIGCLKNLGDYQDQTVIRTATLLDKDGYIKLYEIKDADKEYFGKKENFHDIAGDLVRKTFASEASPHLHIHHMYSLFKENVEKKGYVLN